MSGWMMGLRSLPMVYQAENSECGLACLAMVSSYFGNQVDLNGLRNQFGPVALGSSAKELLVLGERLNLRGRAIRFEPEDLGRLKLPAVLHWDMDHFVVLKKLGRKEARIHDPASGPRSYRLDELPVHLTGVGIEFSPTSSFKKATKAPNIKVAQLFGGVDLSPTSVLQVFIMTLVLQFLALLNPLYLQLVIDQGLINGDSELILMLALLFVVLTLMRVALAQLRSLFLMQYGNRIGFQLVGNSAHHLLSLPLDFFSRREIGDIVSRFGSLETIRKLVTQEMITVIVDGLFSVITLVLLFMYSPILATIVSAAVTVAAGLRLLALSHEGGLRKLTLTTGAKQQTRFMENIRTIRTTKVNGIELDRLSDWESSYASQLNAGYKLESFQVSLNSVQSLLLGVENICVVYFGASAVISGGMTLGQLMSFVFLKQHFSNSVLAMLPKLSELRLINLELERVSDILLAPGERLVSKPPLISQSLSGDVVLKNLSLSYHGLTKNLLNDINFTFQEGETTALTGKSGCGKTTLLKVLLRLDPVYTGNISIGGRDLISIDRTELRTQVSAVLHGDDLLAGDLAYNIHLGRDAGNRTKLAQVCDRLGISSMVENLPLGFCTEIGELGSILSAGQIQRVLLARALYRSPRLLLLDEALSHLNREAAISLLQELKDEGITIVLVTHDPELVAYADNELRLG
ncbi:MAG: peptidase domain-containing ABC transporter [Pseudomonadales bacterium]|nr:peptidase domain-containing ABC transporter [Pseudomonadales bacterium]